MVWNYLHFFPYCMQAFLSSSLTYPLIRSKSVFWMKWIELENLLYDVELLQELWKSVSTMKNRIMVFSLRQHLFSWYFLGFCSIPINKLRISLHEWQLWMTSSSKVHFKKGLPKPLDCFVSLLCKFNLCLCMLLPLIF